jgi:hypothetical protein
MDLAPDDAGPDVRCCDVGCLPATTADLDGPFDTRSVCSGRTSSGANPTVRFETSIAWTKTLETAWAAANCVEPVETADGSMGTLRRFGECPAERDDCRVADLAGPDAEGPRTYKVRIESPPGSVVGSDDLEIEMPDPQDPQVVVDLPPRVLVRGFVTLPADVCDPAQEEDRDCGSDGAVVLAERLAMPGETTTNTPGPYFHELPTGVHPITGKQGYYVAPLDPGVYVMTALPAGTRGGPAPLIVVDLQESPKGLDRNFELETGKFVQLEIRSFDRRSQVVPIDTGSWQSLPQLLHPAGEGEPVDLNAVGECLAIPSDGRPQACRIRRLTPGSSLPPTQVGQVRFSARDISDGRDCTSRQD